MSAHFPDGGPAFPSPMQDDRDCAPRHTSGYGGMTLRDWFAGQALVGIMASGKGTSNVEVWGAPHAYALADAMLVERARGGAK